MAIGGVYNAGNNDNGGKNKLYESTYYSRLRVKNDNDKLALAYSYINIPIDLGLDYQQNSGGADIFDVAVSTQLFNNRLIVNGSIGNRQYGTTSSQEVVGDIDIEIKIDRGGTLRGSVFLHSADQYTNYLDNLQRSGIGISYQREFDTFKELFRSLLPFAFKKSSQKLPVAMEKPKVVVMIEEDD